MNTHLGLRSVILIASFVSVALPARAHDPDRPRAGIDRTSPVAALQAILRKVDHNTMPCWCDKRFGAAASPYVTSELISAVAYGGRIAREKSIDLYDAEFFTGRPELHTVRIKHADVLRDDGERAVVRAQLLINESEPKWPQPLPITYDLRKVAGTWKVDDIEWATGEPSLKTHFLHPES